MITDTLTFATKKGYLASGWSVGETYDSLVMPVGVAKPTQAQIDSWEAERQAAKAAVAYRLKRKAAYIGLDVTLPGLGSDKGDFINTLGDVCDAIIKQQQNIVTALASVPGVTLAVDPTWKTMVDRIAAIKSAYPK